MASTDPYEKSQRSVFVGNIPYEATEEKLKEIFSVVGPVVSFKLVYDRENGKPKGYGFCEYKDPSLAMSAMRNLNGHEIGGRNLRVDNACTEKNRMEMQNLMGSQQQMGPGGPMNNIINDSPWGEPVDPEKAPESISKAVASLPPENMFELMKQMKQCIENNPHEARVMLNQNPQLAYALLQAQVVMRIVDPELAVTMLHKTPPRPPNFAPNQPMPMQQDMPPFGHHQGPPAPPHIMGGQGQRAPMLDGPGFGGPPSHQGFNPEPSARPAMRDPRDDRYASSGPRRDPRSRDPRGGGGGYSGPSGSSQPLPSQRNSGPPGLPASLAGADPAKAELIMQVLQLTDEQIAMLPADQRASIFALKKQINESGP